MKDRFVALITNIASFVLVAAVILMTVQVVLRFGFNAHQAWAEEVDRYLFVWAVYLGCVVALAKGTHIRVTFLIDLGGPRLEKISRLLGGIVNFISFGYVAYYGYQLAYANRNASFYTVESLPLVIFYLAVPVGMTLMVIHMLWPNGKRQSNSAQEPN
jgi:C4-dicarboxylate transporter DctQ subunit